MIIISTIASMQPTVKPQNAQACDKAMKMGFVFNFLLRLALPIIIMTTSISTITIVSITWHLSVHLRFWRREGEANTYKELRTQKSLIKWFG